MNSQNPYAPRLPFPAKGASAGATPGPPPAAAATPGNGQNPQGAQNYLRAKVMTATPEQLQLMLYDGALRFGEQAKAALLARNFEQGHAMISRVQKILTEMSCTLKHHVFPELCGKLASLYNFAYRKLIEANTAHGVEPLDEALSVLRYQRETWALLLSELGKKKAAAFASRLDLPEPDARMEATLSVRG